MTADGVLPAALKATTTARRFHRSL